MNLTTDQKRHLANRRLGQIGWGLLYIAISGAIIGVVSLVIALIASGLTVVGIIVAISLCGITGAALLAIKAYREIT